MLTAVVFLSFEPGCGRINYDPGGGIGPDSALLASLELTSSEPQVLRPAFEPEVTSYTSDVPLLVEDVTVTATAFDPTAQVEIEEAAIGTGTATGAVALPLGDSQVNVVVTTTTGATETYQVVVSRAGTIAQSVYIKASNTDAGDNFGENLALFGNTLAVGASTEDSSATGSGGDQADNGQSDAGAVYVFTREGGEWTQEAYLKASNPGASDEFGFSISLSGDTLAVGAPGEASSASGVGGDETDDTATGAGAVYVFTRAADGWTQQAYIKASNPDAGDLFGFAVAVDGDTLVVGSFREDSAAVGPNGDQSDNSAPDAGSAYVFTRTAGTWTQQAYLKASNTDAFDEFGRSVEVSDDTVVVGAIFEASNAAGGGNPDDNSADDAGAAYVFTRTADSWTQQAYLKASNAEGDEWFSGTMALSGDTLAIGALREDSAATGIDGDQANNDVATSGAVYVFTRVAGAWSQEAYIKASNPDPFDQFSLGLALSGDIMAVGAFAENSTSTGIDGEQSINTADNAGAVYLFTRTAGTWIQDAYIKASNTDANDLFGRNVALTADTLVVGAREEASSARGPGADQSDNSMAGAGAAYVFQ